MNRLFMPISDILIEFSWLFPYSQVFDHICHPESRCVLAFRDHSQTNRFASMYNSDFRGSTGAPKYRS